MTDWLIPGICVAVIVFIATKTSHYVQSKTGRSSHEPTARYALTVGLGVGLSVLAVGAITELPLPWKTFVAGAAGSLFSLVAQAFFGKKAFPGSSK
jgi:energy-converting hydrogenase Eha subunit A